MAGLRGRVGTCLTGLPYALIAAGAFLRIAPHPANFAPIGAIALFGGAVFPGVWGVAVPLAALLCSDAVLGFYPGWIWVYGSFVLIAWLGRTLRGRRPALRIAGTALASSILFFVLTNFGEWVGPLYPHTWAGLRADFLAAIPFFRNTALSDIAYASAFFGLYDGALRWAQVPATAAAPPAVQRTT